jgi:hypothetical protein
MAGKLVIRSRAEDPNLCKGATAIEQAAWADMGYLNYTRAHYEFFQGILDQYPEYQLCLVDEETGYPVASANSVPIACAGGPEALPPEGWDWLVEMGAKGGGRKDYLGGLAISVPAVHRSKGYARRMIHGLLMLAAKKNLKGVVVAVRPSAKHQHPNVSIDDYITWTTDDGRAYDPWLRSHIAAGCTVVKPCHRSMVVEEPVQFWETWTKREYKESGSYVLPGGLTPIEIDMKTGKGLYAEPNVWVSYSV